MKNYPKTFNKIKIKDIFIKNRVISSPLSINMSLENGDASKNTIDFFENIAKNNFGIVTIGGTAVSKSGRNTRNEMFVGSVRQINNLKKLSKSIKKNGAKATIQLSHVGPQGNSKYNDYEVVGSSTYKLKEINIEVRPLKIKEIIDLEDKFVSSALLAWEAGFDFIEFQMAHGYLIHSFLSEFFNKRNDKYGGSEENRFRFIKNIVTKIRNKNKKIRLCARISGDDFIKDGLNLKKLKDLVKFFDLNNFSYYTVTAGIYETAKMKYVSMKSGKYWEYAKELKKMTSTPVVAQGGIKTVQEGENLLKNNICDFFGMCQAVIADPEIVTKTLNKEEEKIFGCVAHVKLGACHRCRYLKQKDVTFDCITPSSWKPKNYNKKIRDLNYDQWKKIINNLNV